MCYYKDGIPNRLDLDSDGDGCSDAIEGGAAFTTSNLVNSSMPGGNSGGSYTGSSSSLVIQNLGNTVGSTATTLGVPTIATTGQTIGTSQNVLVNSCVCYNNANTGSAGVDTKHGITLLQRAGEENGNWPMIRKSAHTVLESNTKGFVLTRMTTTEINAIVSPQEGMMVYDTVAKCLKLYDGAAWSCFSTPACP